jgi:hypothetical protein
MNRLLPLLVALAACGGARNGGKPPPPPPSPDAAPVLDFDDDDARDTAAGLIEFYAAMAAIVEQRAAGPDCPAMAADLEALFVQVAPMFAIVEAVRQDAEASRRLVAALDVHADEARPLAERISAGLSACQMDPAVAAAVEKMPVL